VFNCVDLNQEEDRASGDVGEGEENEDPLDPVALVLQLLCKVQLDVPGEVDVGCQEAHRDKEQLAREGCVVCNFLPWFNIFFR